MKNNLRKYLEPVREPEGWSIHYSPGWERRTGQAKKVAIEQAAVPIEIVKQDFEQFCSTFGIEATVSIEDFSTNSPPDVDKRTIWAKFSKDGYLVVIGTGEISFDMPDDAREYHKGKPGNWDWPTSAILCHYVNKEWDKSKVILCKMTDIPKGFTLKEVKRAIGNYLQQDKGIPIIDYYNHQIEKNSKRMRP